MIDSLISSIITIKDKYLSGLDLTVNLTDIIEILILTFVVYYVLIWFRNTRAWNLFKGILVILLLVLVAAIFEMNTILWIAEKFFAVGLTALVVIFQPELRRALETFGRRNIFSSFFNSNSTAEDKFSDKTINELVKASYEMGKVKTGALIVIENDTSLAEYERTGIAVDGMVTSQLLLNIFEKNTPLHDGAVIIRGDRVAAATCYLPLSDNMELSKELGTRHRAAVGISEVSDSLTIIVSEETGGVSIAMNDILYQAVDPEILKKKLQYLQSGKTEEENEKRGRLGFGRRSGRV